MLSWSAKRYFSGFVTGVKLERFSRFDFLRSHIELVAILFFWIEGLWHGNFLPSVVFSIDLPGQHLAGVLYGQCSSLAAFRLGRAVQLASCFSLVQCNFLCFSRGHTGFLGLGGYASPPFVSYGQLFLNLLTVLSGYKLSTRQ